MVRGTSDRAICEYDFNNFSVLLNETNIFVALKIYDAQQTTLSSNQILDGLLAIFRPDKGITMETQVVIFLHHIAFFVPPVGPHLFSEAQAGLEYLETTR